MSRARQSDPGPPAEAPKPLGRRLHEMLDSQTARRPSAMAVFDAAGTELRYGCLSGASEAVAVQLATAGVAPGDRVAILCENCAEAVVALFGAWRAGAWAIPINARLTAPEVDRVLEHARPRAVLATSAGSPDAARHGERLGARPRGRVTLATPFPSDPGDEPEVAVLLYTTGTTGQPKAVMLTHANLLFSGRASARVRGMGPDDTVLGVLPMTHVFGLASMAVAGITAGAALRLLPRFDPAAVLRALDEGATIFPGVPQMHAALMRHARERGRERLDGRLRYVSAGGAPLDPRWKREAEAFYGLPLQNGYGLTESTSGTAATRNALGDPDASVGPPLEGIEVRIDEGVPGGGEGFGEILTRGPHVMRGYWRAPEETAAVLGPDGWLRTGDLGRIDEVGRLHVVGRCKELIIRGGFNVHPPEVEAALNDHPAVAQCAVVGRPREGGDEEVVAFVQLAAPATEAELSAWAAERLAGYKRPSRIVTADALPCAPTGKVLKHELLRFFADRLR